MIQNCFIIVDSSSINQHLTGIPRGKNKAKFESFHWQAWDESHSFHAKKHNQYADYEWENTRTKYIAFIKTGRLQKQIKDYTLSKN